MKYVDIRDLPPCALSPQCLRLLDDLDMPPTARAPAQLTYIDDLQDERQLRQLRSHVPGCPTCSALLAEARRMRTQQRTMLHHFLLANEQRVPATTRSIFAALRREQAQQETAKRRATRAYARSQARKVLAEHESKAPQVFALHPRLFQPRNVLQHVLTLATVLAVILATVGLLNRASSSSTARQPTSHPQSPDTGAGSEDWNSVVIGLTLVSAVGVVKGFTIYNYDAPTGHLDTLYSSSHEALSMKLEEVSNDGRSLLYDATSLEQQTSYATLSSSSTPRPFYQQNARFAGDAIWMDASHALIQDLQGTVLKVNVQSNLIEGSWQLDTAHLAFYHTPFLYYTSAVTEALYRMDLSRSDSAPQRLTGSLPNTRFWLSPYGTTIFYMSGDSSVAPGIYAINTDGTHVRQVYAGTGIPIGYAQDNTLMVLQQVGTKLQALKVGATAQQKPQVMLADVAPGAISLCGPTSASVVIALCDENVALSPYGHGLLVHAYYADGSHSLVYDDLATGSSRKILAVPASSLVQLPGWSRMVVGNGAKATNAPTTLCSCEMAA